MKLDDIKKLQQKKYREELGHFLIEGEHLVLELQKAAERNPLLKTSELYVTSDYAHWQSTFRTHVIDDRQMAKIADTKTPQGIVALVPILPEPDRGSGTDIAIYLHEVQDPGNLGTILRTLAWFGHFRCLLSPGSVDPYNPKAVRASMGAIFHVPIERDVALESLSARFKRIACLDMHGEPLTAANFDAFDCYLFGNEARGLVHIPSSSAPPQPFTIPGCGAIDSLNLASAVTLCAYELNRRR